MGDSNTSSSSLAEAATALRSRLEKLAINRPAPQDKAALKEWEAEVALLLPKVRAAEEAFFQSLRAPKTAGRRRTRKHRSRRRRSRRHR